MANATQLQSGGQSYIIRDAIARSVLNQSLGLLDSFSWSAKGLYSDTGIEYSNANKSASPFIDVKGNSVLYISSDNTNVGFVVYEFASDATTTISTNTRLRYSGPYTSKNNKISLLSATKYIRITADVAPASAPDIVCMGDNGAILQNISDLSKLAMTSALVNNYGVTPVAPYDDADTFPKQSVVLAYGSSVDNLPDTSSAFVVLTINPLNHNTNAINTQFAINVINYDVWIRTAVSGETYQNWKSLTGVALTSALVTNYGVDPVAPYDDANTFPKQSVVLAYGNKVANLPNTTSGFTVATLCGLAHNINATTYQLAADVTTNKLYFRSSKTSDSYENWVDLTYQTGIVVNPSDNLAEAIAKATAMGNVKIIVNGGNHNILTEYGITDERTTFPDDFDYRGPKLGNNVVLQGINGAKITAIYGGSDTNVKDLFSGIMVVGSCEIHGLNFESTNVRYCVHDDCGGSSVSAVRVVITDCRMKHNGTNGDYTANCCIGGGTHRSSEHIIERCVMSSPVSYPYPVSYHNNTADASTYGAAHVSVVNCALLNGGAFQLYNYRTSGGTNIEVLFCGNYMGADIHYTGGSSDIFTVYQFNNTKY